jgi:uncharacterized protein
MLVTFMYKFLLPSILLILVVIAGAFYLREDGAREMKDSFAQGNSTSNPSDTVMPQPTPFPYQEMTINYLRSRGYKSELGSLEKVAENQSYTSYLTNFDSDGLKVNGQLTRPKGEVPEGGWPAIVFIHGYIPPRQYQTLQNYSSYVDFLARNGFVVFKIDLRGHGQSEGEPGGAYYSSDYVIDTLNAYSALGNSDFINKEKIGLWGHSMAGNLVLMLFGLELFIHIKILQITAFKIIAINHLIQVLIESERGERC